MTIKELQTELNNRQVPNAWYSILNSGNPNEKLCLSFDENIWQIFYNKNGEKTGLKTFESESEACIELLQMLEKALVR